MPINPALIQLLGASFSDSSPQKNPKFVGIDSQGNYINGESPYQTPGFMTKAFRPEVASQAGQLNNAAFQEGLQNTITRNILAQNLGAVPKEYRGGDLSMPAQVSLFPNPSATALEAGKTSIANIQAGNPNAQAKNTAAGLESSTRELSAGNFLFNPESAATMRNKELNYGIARTGSLMSNLPAETDVRAKELAGQQINVPLQSQATQNTLEGDITRNPQQQELYNKLLAAHVDEATIQQILSAVGSSMAGSQALTRANEIQSLQNQSIGNLALSRQIPPGSGPMLGGSINQQGNIDLGGRNPFYVGPNGGLFSAMANGGIPGMGQQKPLGATLPSGQPLPMASRTINPQTGLPVNSRPTIGNVAPTSVPVQTSPVQNSVSPVSSIAPQRSILSNINWGQRQTTRSPEQLAQMKSQRLEELQNKKLTYTISPTEEQELNVLLTNPSLAPTQ